MEGKLEPESKFSSTTTTSSATLMGAQSHDNAEKAISRTASLLPFRSLLHEILFVGLICVAQFTTQATLGQTLNLLEQISAHFGTEDAGTRSWFVAGFSLTVGTFILVFGRFGDHFGHKRMLIIGYAWFSLWSVIVGVTYYASDEVFVWARVMQGIGPAICIPNGVAVLGATYPPGLRRNIAFSLFGAVAPAGTVVGAIFAGLMQNNWPWAYYSLGLVLAASTVVSVWIIPTLKDNDRGKAKPDFWQLLKILDIAGGAIGVMALVLINFAWNQAPIESWAAPDVITTLIVGVLLVPAFFVYEIRYSSSPLIPFDAINKDVGFVLTCITCGWASFGIWIFYSWQFFQVIRGADLLLTAAFYVPCIISGSFAAIAVGVLLRHIHPAWVMVMSLAAFTISLALMATAPPDQIYWAQTFVSVFIISLGIDGSFPAGTILLSNSVSSEHQGIAASLVNTVVNYSISIGLGIAGTVESQTLTGDLLVDYRHGLYVGLGLAGFGFLLSLLFTWLRVYATNSNN